MKIILERKNHRVGENIFLLTKAHDNRRKVTGLY